MRHNVALLVLLVFSLLQFVFASLSPYQVASCTRERVRRDWSTLSQSERRLFGRGFEVMVFSSCNSVSDCMKDFVERYGELLENNTIDDSNSLLFHKVFLLEIEDKMREKLNNYEFTLPYGDWEPYIDNPVKFDTVDLGPAGTPVNLPSSIFGSVPFSLHKFNRVFAVPEKKVNEADLRKALGSKSFNQFNKLLTEGLQKIINLNYGGSMTSLTVSDNAALDPIWLLHQVNIQRLFQNWQTQNPSETFPSELITDTTLPGYTSITPQSAWPIATGCVTYGPPVYSPLSLIGNEIGVALTSPQVPSQVYFWVPLEKKKKKKRGSVDCNEVNDIASLFNVKVSRDYGLRYLDQRYDLFNSSTPSPMRTYILSVLDALKLDPSSSYPYLFEKVKSKIDFGIGFDYAVYFAQVFTDLELECQFGIIFGGKYPQPSDDYFMTRVLTTLQKERNFRRFVNSAANIYMKASSTDSPGNIPLQSDLKDLGNQIFNRFLSLVSPVSTSNVLSNKTFSPSVWRCPRGWYNSSDGCDCWCGEVDPDCLSDVNNTIFAISEPVFGCGGTSGVRCINGGCEPGPDPPLNWTCEASNYNSTDGCDCNCGAHDPDCDEDYSGSYEEASPYLYEIKGCIGGKGAFCDDGECEYETIIPAEWTCANDAYSDGELCDCNCGTYDPDCDQVASEITGCACPSQNCLNTNGICQGTCGNVQVRVDVAPTPITSVAPTTTSPSSSSSSSTVTPTPTPTTPPICLRTSGGAKANEAFLDLLNVPIQ